MLGRICLLATLLAALAAPAAGAAPLRIGVFDHVLASSDPAERAVWLDRAESAGTQVVRLPLSWPGIAPVRPADPADPTDPAYRWSAIDAAVDDARARGIDVLLSIDGAPEWAQAADRPGRVSTSGWKPSPRALRAFATAAARRFAGRVREFQVWNEPNLERYLAPQWVKRRGRWRPFAPGHYRRMLNAASAGLRSVDPGIRVVTAGTAPYGDPLPGGSRIMPVRFWRTALRKRMRFDVLAHHPYAVGGPNRRALNRDDVALPDIGKLRRLVPRKPIWVTEVSWDSSPPDPYGVPARRHARWMAEAFHVLWRQGVGTVLWFQIRDQPRGAGYEYGNQSGFHFHDGRAKRSRAAFAFPFVARAQRARTLLWGRAPATGRVRLERRKPGGWRRVASAAQRSDGVFVKRVPGRGTFRARVGRATSLPFPAR